MVVRESLSGDLIRKLIADIISVTEDLLNDAGPSYSMSIATKKSSLAQADHKEKNDDLDKQHIAVRLAGGVGRDTDLLGQHVYLGQAVLEARRHNAQGFRSAAEKGYKGLHRVVLIHAFLSNASLLIADLTGYDAYVEPVDKLLYKHLATYRVCVV